MAEKWWKKSLVYQIYPLSFNDSNGDGTGDINGIISKLDYLKNLGVDVIWLSPIYESPMDDNGYDISNYYEINPIFGTMNDFKELLKEVKARNMKLIMDLVINHTSDEHFWFKDAISSKKSKYRDYYIWRKDPNDIESVFSGSSWEYEPNSQEYYFHLFSKKQPDLNWNNKSLREEIYRMINYWLDLGIDGFRLDVIDLIGKDIDKKSLADGPFLEDYLKEMYEACFKGRDIMTVGETPGISIKRAMELSSEPTNYLDMVFQFSHISLDEVPGKGKWHTIPLDLVKLKNVFQNVQKTFEKNGWTSLFWSNHDQPRAVSRYGNDNEEFRELSAKMLLTMLYGLKGTAFLYQGEELGMTSIKLPNITDYKDLETINMYNDFINKGYTHEWIMNAIYIKSRDNSRTPMQWDDTLNAGFTNGTPWLNVNSNYQIINAKEQVDNPNSIYNYTKKLFEVRKHHDVFFTGETIFLNMESKVIFDYKRVSNNDELLVIANYSQEFVNYIIEDYDNYQILITNYENYQLNNINNLPPYYAAILRKVI